MSSEYSSAYAVFDEYFEGAINFNWHRSTNPCCIMHSSVTVRHSDGPSHFSTHICYTVYAFSNAISRSKTINQIDSCKWLCMEMDFLLWNVIHDCGLGKFYFVPISTENWIFAKRKLNIGKTMEGNWYYMLSFFLHMKFAFGWFSVTPIRVISFWASFKLAQLEFWWIWNGLRG